MPMKPRGKPFKPGQSGNPGGRVKETHSMKEIRKLTQQQIEEMASLILNGNVDELKRIAQSSESSTLQVWISSGAITGIKKGDMGALNAILDRIVGKVKTPIGINEDTGIKIIVEDYTKKVE